MPRICADKCQWLLRRQFKKCEKSCTGEYCSMHRYRYKKGSRVYPCVECGIGVHNKFKLCIKCGYKKAYKKDAREKDKKAKKDKKANEGTDEVVTDEGVEVVTDEGVTDEVGTDEVVTDEAVEEVTN